MQERCIPCCTRKWPIRMDTTVCIRCVFYAGYHGIMLQATTATTVVVERRQDTTSKSLKIHATLPRDSCHTTLKTAFHKSIYERQSLPKQELFLCFLAFNSAYRELERGYLKSICDNTTRRSQVGMEAKPFGARGSEERLLAQCLLHVYTKRLGRTLANLTRPPSDYCPYSFLTEIQNRLSSSRLLSNNRTPQSPIISLPSSGIRQCQKGHDHHHSSTITCRTPKQTTRCGSY